MDARYDGAVNMKILARTMLFFMLGTMFVSLFHMSTGMDMSAGMTDCPFASGQETICPMEVTDHMTAWKNAFLAAIPSLTLLLTLAGVAILVASVAPNLLQSIRYLAPPLPRWLQYRTYTYPYRPLQELFSSGILHPKLF